MTNEEYKAELNKIREENKEIQQKQKLKAERGKYKEKMNTSTKVLIASITAVTIAFVLTMIMQWNDKTVNDTLITLWFGFWTAEIVMLTGIKVSKVRNQNDKDETEEEEEALG